MLRLENAPMPDVAELANRRLWPKDLVQAMGWAAQYKHKLYLMERDCNDANFDIKELARQDPDAIIGPGSLPNTHRFLTKDAYDTAARLGIMSLQLEAATKSFGRKTSAINSALCDKLRTDGAAISASCHSQYSIAAIRDVSVRGPYLQPRVSDVTGTLLHIDVSQAYMEITDGTKDYGIEFSREEDSQLYVTFTYLTDEIPSVSERQLIG